MSSSSSSYSNKKRKANPSQTLSPTKNPHQQEDQKFEEHGNGDGLTDVPYLPTPIVADILSRLRIKLLFNCRLVCKRWASIISTPEFAQLHLSRSPTSCLIQPINKKRQSKRLHLVDPEDPYSRENKLVFIPNITLPKVPIDLINSCNGLVCLSQYHSDDTGTIFVCNPILREYITLPKPPRPTKYKFLSCAIGFSHKTNQYKVIFIPYTENSSDYRVWIYTLGEGSWRSIDNAPECDLSTYFNAFVGSSIHWIWWNPFISSFDFVTERFGVVPEPSEFTPLDKQFSDQMQLGALNGNLTICNYAYRDHVAIWVMKDYGVRESWSKDIIITHMILETKFDTYEPMLVTGDGEILVIFSNDSIMLYDPKTDCFKCELKIFGVSSRFTAISHVTSLISLKDVAKGENLKVLGSN